MFDHTLKLLIFKQENLKKGDREVLGLGSLPQLLGAFALPGTISDAV
jgi:hypothetical protein